MPPRTLNAKDAVEGCLSADNPDAFVDSLDELLQEIGDAVAKRGMVMIAATDCYDPFNPRESEPTYYAYGSPVTCVGLSKMLHGSTIGSVHQGDDGP